ncbi:MAG: hypothetical protein HY527_22550 [Betaproteobacteria bacterium]|nr:hypothetical protein [Betaproteobacteria bacterium]
MRADRESAPVRWLYRALAALNVLGALLVVAPLIDTDSLRRTLISDEGVTP